ncbi:hypothetical protein GCM10027589_37200 [Actinocorallia lasiicapitis]
MDRSGVRGRRASRQHTVATSTSAATDSATAYDVPSSPTRVKWNTAGPSGTPTAGGTARNPTFVVAHNATGPSPNSTVSTAVLPAAAPVIQLMRGMLMSV